MKKDKLFKIAIIIVIVLFIGMRVYDSQRTTDLKVDVKKLNKQ